MKLNYKLIHKAFLDLAENTCRFGSILLSISILDYIHEILAWALGWKELISVNLELGNYFYYAMESFVVSLLFASVSLFALNRLERIEQAQGS